MYVAIENCCSFDWKMINTNKGPNDTGKNICLNQAQKECIINWKLYKSKIHSLFIQVSVTEWPTMNEVITYINKMEKGICLSMS